jgi:hypothetical protein
MWPWPRALQYIVYCLSSTLARSRNNAYIRRDPKKCMKMIKPTNAKTKGGGG